MSRPKKEVLLIVLNVYKNLHESGKLPIGSAGYKRWQTLQIINKRK